MNTRIEVMKELYSKGKTLQEIGDFFSISKQRVGQLLKDVISKNEGGARIRTEQKQKEYEESRDKRYLKKWGKTYSEYLATGLPHGRSKYINEGCKCDICKKANNDAAKSFYNRTKVLAK